MVRETNNGDNISDIIRKPVLTTTEAADISGLSRQYIASCFDDGRLKGYRVPGSTHRRIPPKNLMRFLIDNKLEERIPVQWRVQEDDGIVLASTQEVHNALSHLDVRGSVVHYTNSFSFGRAVTRGELKKNVAIDSRVLGNGMQSAIRSVQTLLLDTTIIVIGNQEYDDTHYISSDLAYDKVAEEIAELMQSTD